jgi:DUF1009 family protein
MSVALIAGTGGLPPHVAGSLMVQGRVPVVCEMRGFPSDIKGEFHRVPFRIETLGSFLKTLTSLGVTEVCMAGAVQRPEIDPTAIDAQTAPMVPRLMAAMAKGDDGTLREIIAIFEERGFTVIAAHQIAPDLMPIAGVHTQTPPLDMTGMMAAAKVELAKMGRVDQGQAMLLRGDGVIAVEDARGTAAMLADFSDPLVDHAVVDDFGDLFGVFGDAIGGVADWLSGKDYTRAPGADAVLFKAPKPDQNMYADVPMIGPDTAMKAAEAGLAGIVIEAGGVMVLDLPQVVAILNAQGMFLWVMPKDVP